MSDIKTTPLPLLVKEGTKGRSHYLEKIAQLSALFRKFGDVFRAE